MRQRVLSFLSIVSVLAITLMSWSWSRPSQAAQPTAPQAQGQKPTPQPKIVGNPTIEGAVEETSKDTTAATYIVELVGEPLATYRGDVAGLPATSPKATGNKINEKSPAAAAYRNYLATQRTQVVNAASQVLGRQVVPSYVYDVAFTGFAATMTGAEAAKLQGVAGIVRITKEGIYTVDTDYGPQWIKADSVWNGTAGLFVAEINGSQENPPVTTAAKGRGVFSLDGTTVRYDISVSGLTPTGAHFHRGARGANGAVIVNLTPAGTGRYVGTATFSSVDAALLASGGVYVNFHTAANAGGEIRGQVVGVRGENVLVGVLDSGINIDHPSFADVGGDGYNHTNPRGTGNYRGACDPTNTPTVAQGNPSGFNPLIVCNDKLIGAWTWPSTAFTLTGIVSPDDSDGHGSHTASTSAGNVITTTTVNSIGFGRISGVAPHANVIGYDVCGNNLNPSCYGAAIVASINQAVADGVDVINYSISGGADAWNNPTELAFLNARDAGVFVATSAGNSGPAASTTEKEAPWTTSVAASTHNRELENRATDITASGGATLPTLFGKGLSGGTGTTSFPIVYAGSVSVGGQFFPLCGTGATGPNSNPFPAGTFTGKIVICDRGVYGRVEKGTNVRAGGAAGMILANNQASSNSLNGDSHSLPAVHISFNDGVTLKAFVAGNTNPVGRISGTIFDVQNANGDIMASFSSRGPLTNLANVLKPDITAPGVDIVAAYASVGGRPTPEFDVISGTSMSGPHIAGSAALLYAVYDGKWSPAEVQSALMTTAENTGIRKEDGTLPTNVFDRGSGRADLSRAIRAGLVLDESKADYLAANPGNGGDVTALNLANFTNASCVVVCAWTRTVSSTLAVTSTWTISYTGSPSLTVSLNGGNSFTLNPYQSRNITVQANSGSAPAGTYVLGTVSLIPTGNVAPIARFPIVVRPAAGQVPAEVTIETRRDTGSQVVGPIVGQPVTALTTRAYGLVPATRDVVNLAEDPTANDPYNNDGGTFVKAVVVPTGAKRLVTEVVETSSLDIDLFLYRDTNNNGTIQPGAGGDFLACTSASGLALESCDLLDPIAGTYLALIQNFDGSNNPTDRVALHTGAVPGAAVGNMTVSGPATVAGGQAFNVTVNYNLGLARDNSFYYGAFDLGTSGSNAGNLGTVRVNLTRLDDGITKTANVAQALPGTPITYTVAVTNFTSLASSIRLTDTLPVGLTVDTTSLPAGAVYNPINRTIAYTATVPGQAFTGYNFTDSRTGGRSLTFSDLPVLNPAAPSLCSQLAQCDDSNSTINFAPDAVSLYGSSFSIIRVNTNGFIQNSAEGQSAGFPVQSMPNPATPNNLFAGLWHDLDLDGTAAADPGAGNLYFGALTGVDASNPSDKFAVFHWKGADQYNRPTSDINFNIVARLNKPNSDFCAIYGTLTGNLVSGGDGEGVAIGIENAGGTLGTTHYYSNTLPLNAPAAGTTLCALPQFGAFQAVFTYRATAATPGTYTNQIVAANGAGNDDATVIFAAAATATPTTTATTVPATATTVPSSTATTAPSSTATTVPATPTTVPATPTRTATTVPATATSIPATPTRTATSAPPTATTGPVLSNKVYLPFVRK